MSDKTLEIAALQGALANGIDLILQMNEAAKDQAATIERLEGAISGILRAVNSHDDHMTVGTMNDLRRAIVIGEKALKGGDR